MAEEIWKDIRGYEGYYQVSTFGNVRSLDGTVTSKLGISKKIKGRMKSQICDESGYKTVTLYKDNNEWIVSVHRLVLMTFDPNENSDTLQVNHIDRNPSNNHISNLEWVTPQGNSKYSARTNPNFNKRPKSFYVKMGSHGKQVRCVNDGKIHDSAVEAANYYGISVNCVYNRCKDGKIVNRFSFEYVDKDYYKRKSTPLIDPSLPGSHKARPVKCLETGQIYPSRTQAANDLKISRASIVDSLHDGRRHSGYTFVEA